jgi:hypothetical protein
MTRMTFALGTVACLVLLCSGSDGLAASLAAEDEPTLHAPGLAGGFRGSFSSLWSGRASS